MKSENHTYISPYTNKPTVITTTCHNIMDKERHFRYVKLAQGYPMWGACVGEYERSDLGASENVLVGRLESPLMHVPGIASGEIEIREFLEPVPNDSKSDYPSTHALVLRNLKLGSEACKWIENMLQLTLASISVCDLTVLLPECSPLVWVPSNRCSRLTLARRANQYSTRTAEV